MRASQPAWRRALGKTFHLLASVWVVGPVQDTQCGFKGFRRDVARDVFARQKVTSIVFDVEVIYLVRRRGYTHAGRADPLGGPARLPDAPGRAPGDPRGVGPVPDPADPPGRPPRRTGTGRSAGRPDPPSGMKLTAALAGCCPSSPSPSSPLAWAHARRRRRHAGLRLPRLPRGRRRGCSTGQPAYDTSFEAAGGFGLFYYPPTFIPLVLPFGLLPAGVATWAWIGWPARRVRGRRGRSCRSRERVRWWIVLLAGLSWPFLYAIKLGQVGPLLFLLSRSAGAGWTGGRCWG